MMNKTDYVDLGLACANVCKVLDRGVRGRRADELSQPVFEAIEQLTTSVKPMGHISSTAAYCTLNRRTIVEIQRRIIEKGQRNLFSRLAHAKDDKENLASWRLDLNKILHVFNVCSAGSVWKSLTTLLFQTELAINTNMVVSDTHAMVSDLHCNALTVQGGTDNQHCSVRIAPIHL
jgi:hypothetical protein